MMLAFGLFVHLDVSSANFEMTLLQLVTGIGTGANYSGPLLALQAQIPTVDNATATSTFGFIRNLSMATCVVIGGVIFQNSMASQASDLRKNLGGSIAEKLSGNEAAANVLLLNTLVATERVVARKAYAASLREMWFLFACTAACGLGISFFVSRKALSKVHKETKAGLGKSDDRVKEGVVISNS